MSNKTHVYRPVVEWTGNIVRAHASIFNSLGSLRGNILRLYLRRVWRFVRLQRAAKRVGFYRPSGPA
jgi:hypothetical protein